MKNKMKLIGLLLVTGGLVTTNASAQVDFSTLTTEMAAQAPSIVAAGLGATVVGISAFAAYKGAGFVKKMFGKFI